MGVLKKGRAKLVVDGRLYLWWVCEDEDSPGHLLHVRSDDRRFAITYALDQSRAELPPPFITVLGREFPGLPDAGGCRIRVRCPRWSDDSAITPGFVRRLIDWCMGDEARPLTRVDDLGQTLSR